jgi:hypothetical protein
MSDQEQDLTQNEPTPPEQENQTESALGDEPSADQSSTVGGESDELSEDAEQLSAVNVEVLAAEINIEIPTSSVDAPLDIWSDIPTLADDADIDAALAAVASLGAAALDEEDEDDIFEDDPIPSSDERWSREYAESSAGLATTAAIDALEIQPQSRPVPRYTPQANLPPLSSLKRGNLGSVVPGLLLIGAGAWLTITTTSGGTVDPLLLAGLAIGGVVISLLAYWIGTARWSRGVAFFAAFIALAAGVIVFTTQPLNLAIGFNLVTGYPLLIAAAGLALLVSALAARPTSRGAFAPGVVLLTAGIIGAAVTLGLIPGEVLRFTAPLWFVPIVLLVVLWLLPLVFRLRRRE